MNPLTQDQFDRNAGALEAEETLRMIAKLPAPEGLEERVKDGLRSAPQRGRLIAWPFASAESWMNEAGMKAAAAAAIVLAVAGGGWGVYSHIKIAPVPSALVEPQLPNGAGRFSNAGAMRVPQTIQGPLVATPAVETQKQDAEKASQITHRQAAKSATHPGASASSKRQNAVR